MEISAEKKKMEMEMEIDGKSSSSGGEKKNMEMEIDTKSCSSMDITPAEKKTVSDTDSAKSSSVKSMDCSYVTPEKTHTPIKGSYTVGSKTDSSVASSPSVTSPVAATSSLTPKKKKSQLSWEFNDDGQKMYTLRCGCGETQRLMASDGNIFRIQ